MRNALIWYGGGRRVGNLGWGCLAVHVFQENAGSLPRVWVVCAEMGVAWHILGVGEVSEP